jgi:hypothetical protein
MVVRVVAGIHGQREWIGAPFHDTGHLGILRVRVFAGVSRPVRWAPALIMAKE